MTATPIPRTVAMTVFGDLETSSLTELPKGRQPITTHVVPDSRPAWVQRMWGLIADEVAAGHQAFVVCPRIDDDPDEGGGAGSRTSRRTDVVEDSDAVDEVFEDDAEREPTRRPIASVMGTLPRLRELLPDLRIEALHGRLPADEKDTIMTAFGRGDIDVLLSTTVIEVGVDVPNATVMAVLDADRFGISQLHQLRGRVGRGSAASFCLLHTQAADGSSGFERLTEVARTQDGAELARADLAARREGDVLGAAQSGGRRRLRLLQLRRDAELIVAARAEATAIVEDDPELSRHPALARALAAELDEDSAAFLEKG
jgi:ATP-dependent DNA helicase RecG